MVRPQGAAMESWGSRREDLSDVRPGVQGDRLVLGQVRAAPPDGRGAGTAGSGSDHRPDWNATASVAINPQQYRRIMPEPAGHQPRVNSSSDKLRGRKVTEIVEADMGQLLPITQSSEGARDAIWSPRLRVVNDLRPGERVRSELDAKCRASSLCADLLLPRDREGERIQGKARRFLFLVGASMATPLGKTLMMLALPPTPQCGPLAPGRCAVL